MAEAEDSVKLDLSLVKQEIVVALSKCSQRGLMHSTKWLSELNFALKEYSLKSTPPAPSFSVEINEDFDHYIMAKSFFDLKEYDRCAFFTDWSQSPRNRFLHFYSRYLSGEKRKTDDMTDYAVPFDITQNSNLQELASDLRRRHSSRSLDGFELYLYGVVLKKLDLLKDAQEILLEAVRQEPLHWGGWLELSSLIVDRTKLDQLKLPEHWITNFFIGHAYLDLQLNDEALEIYWALQEKGFDKSNYITAQIAMIHHNKRDVDIAIQTFRQLEKMDPFRLDNLDTYSNLLYVKEFRVDLAHLAHKACEIDKYKVETCCVVGNYYSLRSEHQKAVVYFQRALKLNPHYLSAWTLMGHEFMEMKNTNAAIQSYRQAIEVNRRDYRAWYGLGQTYEILKMMFYCLYYYKQAQHLRPNDSRMLIALGETYEKLDKIQSAIKCYYKARGVGDIEGTALLKLAKLYDKLNEVDQAAAAYTEYVNDSSSTQIADKNEHSAAFKYLANYHVKRNLDDAHRYATSCLEFEETKEEAKALLRTIAQKRSQQESEAAEADATAPLTRTRPRIADGAAANQVGPINLSFNC